MSVYVALLRAVNLGGGSTLPMADLVALAEGAGFRRVRTYIASGNVVFESDASEADVKAALEAALATYAGKAIAVMVRTAEEMQAILAANPFPERTPARTAVVFLDESPPADALERVVAPGSEEVRLGARELYIHYPNGMGRSKLRVPVAARGTARNMNTVARLAAIAAS